ncbi:putative ubiquinol-cytochrome C reductase iron-sulfur subunit [Morchella snyderi]|nr:putative ubiquinol-cytochrome C reductase iron-sulfur subunit [Morchella snyderi]
MNCLKVAAQRAATRSIVPRTAAAALSARSISTYDSNEYKSPFAAAGKKDTTRIPDFSKYKGGNQSTNKLFGYFMVGTMGVLSAAGAKAIIQDFLVNMTASADVLAMAKVEVDLTAIPEGKNVIIKWRGKPIFIRHRTPDEIEEANAVKIESLRDPQSDTDRVKQPEWLIMVGICTHLGCVPIGESGDFGGWFCPCHGSHYDISGRIRRGPAPLNLEIPEYDFPEEGKLIIG